MSRRLALPDADSDMTASKVAFILAMSRCAVHSAKKDIGSMKKLLFLLPLLGLAACSTPEMKVRNSLMKAGLSAPMASCMAERMVDRLSMAQLRRLSSLSSLKERDVRDMTIDEFIYRSRALQDPEILRVVTSSGLRCAIVS